MPLMGSRYWYCAIAEHISFLSPDWFRKAAEKLGLERKRIEMFSHKNVGWLIRVSEVVKNFVHKFLPSVWRTLRRSGIGGFDCSRHPLLAEHPPSWLSAQDHMIVLLRKP